MDHNHHLTILRLPDTPASVEKIMGSIFNRQTNPEQNESLAIIARPSKVWTVWTGKLIRFGLITTTIIKFHIHSGRAHSL